MASAIEHYRAAEKLLEPLLNPAPGENEQRLKAAHVHAMLAVAGATALQAYSDGSEDELEHWASAAGDPAQDGD